MVGLNSLNSGGKGFIFHPSLPIFYEDNHLLALYKPAGLLTQADSSEKPNLLDLAKKWIKITYNKPGNVFLGLVHRLDKFASGIILFAKTSKAAARLTEQFKTRLVDKTYLVVVEGLITKNSGILIHHVKPGRLKTTVLNSEQEGTQKAELWYEVLDRSRKLRRTFLKVKLVTGRKHQIRAQFSFIGHPVLGDLLYGSRVNLPGKALALFAHQLSFIHPTKKIPINLSSPLPASWPWNRKVLKDENLLWLWEDIKIL